MCWLFSLPSRIYSRLKFYLMAKMGKVRTAVEIIFPVMLVAMFAKAKSRHWN